MYQDKKEIAKKVGCNIRKFRKEKNLSMERLAAICEMEYSQVRRIEHGIINTTIYQVYKISETLKVPMSILFNKVNMLIIINML
jgi:transcriptional regulator with XRE-family HTH domain